MATDDVRTLPLSALREYAEAHPDEWIDLNSCRACLACKVTGQSMGGHFTFAPGGTYEQVPECFARMTYDADRTNRPDLASDNEGQKFFKGSELAPAIQRLENGDCPFDVADALNAIAAAVPA